MSKGNKPTKGSETMRLTREQQLIRLENALAKGMATKPSHPVVLQGLLTLYENTPADDEDMRKTYWKGIKAVLSMDDKLKRHVEGKIPFSVKQRIHQIADSARNELYQAYINLQRDIGFLPIKVDTEELGSIHHIAHDAAHRVYRSVVRRLTIAHKAGGWDGSIESAPNHFGQRSLDAPDFMEVFE